MAFGNPSETSSEKKARLYKEYFEAGRSGGEYSAMLQSEIRQQIDEIEEADSWRQSS